MSKKTKTEKKPTQEQNKDPKAFCLCVVPGCGQPAMYPDPYCYCYEHAILVGLRGRGYE